MKSQENSIAVFGYLSSESGVAESCRGLVMALDAVKAPSELYDFKLNPSRKNDTRYVSRCKIDAPISNSALIHVNADQVDEFFNSSMGQLAGPVKRKFGYWYWELEDFPDRWIPKQSYFDEIWVATEFVRDSLAQKLAIPIRVIPPAYEPFPAYTSDREHFGLPADKKLLLAMFDGFSFMDRKNPLGTVAAIRELFKMYPELSKDVALVIKGINLSAADQARLLEFTQGIEVHIITKYLTREEVYKLMASVDLYTSLHRSEGLGLACMEAMMIGIPVLATGYSGNISFMNAENSFLVDFKRVYLGYDRGPYFSTNVWAEPDYKHAAAQIYEALSDSVGTAAKVAKAKVDAIHHFSPLRIGQLIQRAISSDKPRSVAQQIEAKQAFSI